MCLPLHNVTIYLLNLPSLSPLSITDHSLTHTHCITPTSSLYLSPSLSLNLSLSISCSWITLFSISFFPIPLSLSLSVSVSPSFFLYNAAGLLLPQGCVISPSTPLSGEYFILSFKYNFHIEKSVHAPQLIQRFMVPSLRSCGAYLF